MPRALDLFPNHIFAFRRPFACGHGPRGDERRGLGLRPPYA